MTRMELPGYVLGAGTAALLADLVRRSWGGFGIEVSLGLMAGCLGLAGLLFVVALRRFGIARASTVFHASFGAFFVAFGVVVLLQGLLLTTATDRLAYGVKWLVGAMLLGAGIACAGHAVQMRTGRAVRRSLADSADIRVD